MGSPLPNFVSLVHCSLSSLLLLFKIVDNPTVSFLVFVKILLHLLENQLTIGFTMLADGL